MPPSLAPLLRRHLDSSLRIYCGASRRLTKRSPQGVSVRIQGSLVRQGQRMTPLALRKYPNASEQSALARSLQQCCAGESILLCKCQLTEP